MKDPIQQDTQKELLKEPSVADSLDDRSRRELLGKIARAGAAAVPISAVLLDQAKAQTTGSPGQGF